MFSPRFKVRASERIYKAKAVLRGGAAAWRPSMFNVGCWMFDVHHVAMKPFLLMMSLLAVPLFAQTPTPAPPSTDATKVAMPLFRAKLPGGMYEVAVRTIVAVTSHEYVVDGIARVTEVNVDT